MPPQRSDLGIGPRPRPQPAAEAVRARVAHFAIFNPSIPAPSKRRPARPDGDVDLSAGEPEADGLGPGVNGDGAILDSDDIEQAAQIVFYMCPADPAVAWDVKLKQVGLVRGLMAFTSYVLASRIALSTVWLNIAEPWLRGKNPGGPSTPTTPGW